MFFNEMFPVFMFFRYLACHCLSFLFVMMIVMAEFYPYKSFNFKSTFKILSNVNEREQYTSPFLHGSLKMCANRSYGDSHHHLEVASIMTPLIASEVLMRRVWLLLKLLDAVFYPFDFSLLDLEMKHCAWSFCPVDSIFFCFTSCYQG